MDETKDQRMVWLRPRDKASPVKPSQPAPALVHFLSSLRSFPMPGAMARLKEFTPA